MPLAGDDLESAIAAAAPKPFEGRVWRVHWREVAGDDWGLSMRSSGRYHRGLDLFPHGEAFAALYTSVAPEIAIWEMVRRSAARNLAYLNNNVLTEMEADLERVLDTSQLSVNGMAHHDLTATDVRPCQRIGAAARSLDFEGLLVPSAALPGLNLVLLPDNLADRTCIRIVRSTELPLNAVVAKRHEDDPTPSP